MQRLFLGLTRFHFSSSGCMLSLLCVNSFAASKALFLYVSTASHQVRGLKAHMTTL